MVKSRKNYSRKYRGGNEPALEEQSKTTVEHLQKNLKNATGKAKEKMQQLLQYVSGLAKTTGTTVETSVQQVESKVAPIVSAPVETVKSSVEKVSSGVEKVSSSERSMLPSHFQSKGGAKKSQKKHKSMKKRKSMKKKKSSKKHKSMKKKKLQKKYKSMKKKIIQKINYNN
jgi:hypothetical protein